MQSETQPQVTLNNGVSMPQLGLGVWRTPQAETAEVVRAAMQAGYQAVDTATVYNNEDGVGDALLDGSMFLTTKLWNADQGYDTTMRAFAASAKRLRRQVVDLYLIHWPDPKNDKFVETWKALVQLHEAGQVRAIGVSNFGVPHLQRIIGETGVTPAVNQIELHPSFQQKELRAFHETHGIHTESWSPLGQGQGLRDTTIGQIAQKHGKTAAQVIIRWHLDSGLIVIPKTANLQRLKENIDVFDFMLDDDDMQTIASLDSKDGRIGPDPLNTPF